MKNLKKYLFIFVFNILTLLLILIVFEISARIFVDLRRCYLSTCDFPRLSNIAITENSDIDIGLYRLDATLGYVPREISTELNKSGWDRKRVNVDQNGLRSTGIDKGTKKPILLVGDSYTFGDQVSDDETWAWCLARELSGRKVANAGVSGFGLLQSYLRMENLLKYHEYDSIIFSILVGNNLERDQLSYRSGFPKPWIEKNNKWLSIVYPDIATLKPGSKWNPSPMWYSSLVLYRNSLIYNRAITILSLDVFGKHIDIREPSAASKEEIAKFIISKLAQANRKIIVVLHYDSLYSDSAVQIERSLLKGLLEGSKIEYIDLHDDFVEMSLKGTRLWHGHYTTDGNNLACNIISSRANNTK